MSRFVWLSLLSLSLIAVFVLSFGKLDSFGQGANPFEEASWPPQVGDTFPDIAWLDNEGKEVRLSEFRGKVLLVEPIGMDCPACISFSDRKGVGEISGIEKQWGLPSIEEMMSSYAGGLSFDHPDLVHVQLILYDLARERPDVVDANLWAEHFEFDRDSNVIVLVPEVDPRNKKSFDTIPGVWLLDRDLKVIRDSTGHRPKHNIYREVMPALEQLVKRNS